MLITLSCRERIDLISLQQSERFNDLDSSTKNIMESILDTREDIIGAMTSKDSLGVDHAKGIGIVLVLSLI
jgi:hypothetical protein